MLQVYTGNGKGKTTAAFGLVLRAHGQGLRATILQFCKRPGGEHAACCRLGIAVDTGADVGSPPWDKSARDEWRAHAQTQLLKIPALMEGADLLVLDEILSALRAGFVDEEQLKGVIGARPGPLELVLTGRAAPGFVLDAADLVTEMLPLKHYYEAGVPARRGIEY